jgi:murein DD-endopeptidase MepM/ murein hydrolase activator NlpD
MYEIWIEEAGKELHRQTLPDGQYTLGRTESNHICLRNPAISRQHLRLDVGPTTVSVTDLGSTNGTQLNGHKLAPHQAVTWPTSEELQIGNLAIHIQPQVQAARVQPAGPEAAPPSAGHYSETPSWGIKIFSIVSSETRPQITQVGSQPMLIGSDPNAAIHIIAANVVHHHCLVQMRNDQVEVTNLDNRNPAILAGTPLTTGQPAPWPLNYPLQIGSATLQLTEQAATAAYPSSYRANVRSDRDGTRWRMPFVMILMGFVAFICFIAFGGLVVQGIRCEGLAASCLFSPFGAGQSGDGVGVVSGRATPTLAPVMTGQAAPSRIATVEFEVGDPTPTSVPVDCAPASSSQAGWIELPFPYQGTAPIFGGGAESFRRISQRSRSGGRINSFFDHEFPVYPAAFGGREPDNLDETLVIFNGVRSDDAYSQDTDTADWYSGHSGLDSSPSNPRQPTTPILAAAEGRLILAKIDNDDNHMVWLEHDPDGDGIYQYATLYFHMHPDEHFANMLAMEERTPISAGQRIGTMGTTGRSSGIHLHFEVRHDIDHDGRFSIFERVDPYGWFPSQEIADDPWSILANWIDTKGREYEHAGIRSDYLWVHPLVDVVDSGGECQQVTNVKIDLYNVLGWSVVDPGFTYIARNEQGEILEVGQPHRRTLTILEDELEGVDPSTLSLEWLNPKLDTWFTYKRADAEPRPGGGFTFSAIVDKTGRYVLVAKETVDRVPPATGISLSGELVDAGSNTYKDSVVVTLNAKDRGLILSPIIEVQYSIDCGKNWTVYNEPFEVTMETPHICGEASGSSETIVLGQNDFLLLALSEDSENNIEQPPAQMRFRIE